MKKYIFTILSAAAFTLNSCDAVLERPELTSPTEENFGYSDLDFRLYVNEAYPIYFVGYNSSWGTAYTPFRGYNFSDDNASTGKQSNFENSVPTSRGSSSTNVANLWLSQYAAGNWNFSMVRKWNYMLQMLDKNQSSFDTETHEHWTAVARFLRGYEYCRLVETFGDVPWYDAVVADNDADQLYKERTPRDEVMGHVYNDFEYALTYMRTDDGDQYLNRYIAAGFVSRMMLFEGTWQKYHENNSELANKYLTQAKEAAEYVMNSGLWSITSDFKSLFGSFDLDGNTEVLMYRHYDSGQNVTHHVASYSNLTESQGGATLALAKEFICNDGKPYTGSDEGLNISEMIRTRDPRFEATFWNEPQIESGTLLYQHKFIDRIGVTYYGGTYPAQYGSYTNTNDYPIMRLSEIMLNWIEAKAELATLGGEAVTQPDIDATINQIRNRPLDEVAIERGVQQTAPMVLADITADFDPARDKGNSSITNDYEVSPLIWEIRRERRMELAFEHSRLLDLKRWKKLHYMDNEAYPETMMGLWIDAKNEWPHEGVTDNHIGVLTVAVPDGAGGYTWRTYDGNNLDQMVGFYIPEGAVARDPFTDRSYMAPIGENVINEYKDQGYTITQTTGW